MMKKLFFTLVICSGLIAGSLYPSPGRAFAQGEGPEASPTVTYTPTVVPLVLDATQTPMAPATATQMPAVQATATQMPLFPATATNGSVSAQSVVQNAPDQIFADSFEAEIGRASCRERV